MPLTLKKGFNDTIDGSYAPSVAVNQDIPLTDNGAGYLRNVGAVTESILGFAVAGKASTDQDFALETNPGFLPGAKRIEITVAGNVVPTKANCLWKYFNLATTDSVFNTTPYSSIDLASTPTKAAAQLYVIGLGTVGNGSTIQSSVICVANPYNSPNLINS